MNRLEYLTQLRRLLEDGGLAEDEINDAMGFYEEIFLDAGAAHEAETAANLGSPEELANKILQDSGIHPQGDSVFQMEAAADPSQARDTDNNVPHNGNSLSKLLVIIITSPIMVQPYVCLCRNSLGDTLRTFKHNNCSFRNRLLPYNRRYSNAFHGLSRRHCPYRCRTYLYRTWRHDCNACYKVHMAWLCKPFQQIHKLCP